VQCRAPCDDFQEFYSLWLDLEGDPFEMIMSDRIAPLKNAILMITWRCEPNVKEETTEPAAAAAAVGWLKGR
jgi:hypothetical protein